MSSDYDYSQLVARLQSSPASPDDAWFTGTAQLLYNLPLSLDKPEVQLGPDSKPYFSLLLPTMDEDGDWTTVEVMLDELVTGRLGLAFSSPTGARFWVIPHGGILSWKLYGTPNAPRFWNAPKDVEKREVTQEPEMFRVGVPNEEMLPPLVCDALRWAMVKQLGIAKPRVGLISRSTEPGVSRVVFGLDPADLGGDEQASEAFKFLLWFMPSCIPTLHVPSLAKADWMMDL